MPRFPQRLRASRRLDGALFARPCHVLPSRAFAGARGALLQRGKNGLREVVRGQEQDRAGPATWSVTPITPPRSGVERARFSSTTVFFERIHGACGQWGPAARVQRSAGEPLEGERKGTRAEACGEGGAGEAPGERSSRPGRMEQKWKEGCWPNPLGSCPGDGPRGEPRELGVGEERFWNEVGGDTGGGDAERVADTGPPSTSRVHPRRAAPRRLPGPRSNPRGHSTRPRGPFEETWIWSRAGRMRRARLPPRVEGWWPGSANPDRLP